MFLKEFVITMLATSLSLAPASAYITPVSLSVAAYETAFEVDPSATEAPVPTATPDPVLAIRIKNYPVTIVCGEKVDPAQFPISLVHAGGTEEDAVPTSVELDTSTAGTKTVTVRYNELMASCSVCIVPGQVKGMHITSSTKTSATVSWDAIQGADRYEIERADGAGGYTPVATVTTTAYEFAGLSQGEIRTVRLRAVSETQKPDGTGTETSVGAYSEDYKFSAKPDDFAGGIKASKIGRKSMTLSWGAVTGASAYAVYYRLSTEDKLTRAGQAEGTTKFKVTELKAGYDYYFTVIPYAVEEANAGAASAESMYGTAPSLPVLTVRGGDETIRINWTRGRAADDFKLYMSETEDGEYKLVETFETPVDFKVYSIHGLNNDTPYYIKMTAERTVSDIKVSCTTAVTEVTTGEADETSSEAKLYKTKKKFMNSPACKNYADFKKQMVYKKSFVVPGLKNTNAGGFNASNMVPQDLAIVGDHIVISAYDLKKTNDSVLYVLDKNTREFETLLVLPHKGHLGGIAYDGQTLWLAYGKKMHALPGARIEEAVESGEPYSDVYHFSANVDAGETVSFITYYKKRIWAGAYNELKGENVYAYRVTTDDNGNPSLVRTGKMALPNRTQGITFTSGGQMIVSRSCQTNKYQRGFMSKLEVYKPTLKPDGTSKRGQVKATLKLPPMNEGIMISGSYTYVIFESAAFTDCAARIDRVIAFKTKKVLALSKK